MKKVNKGAVVGLVIGIIIAVFGVVQYFGADAAFEQSKADSYSFSKSTPYAVKYSFGADFYTEMFGITYDCWTNSATFPATPRGTSLC